MDGARFSPRLRAGVAISIIALCFAGGLSSAETILFDLYRVNGSSPAGDNGLVDPGSRLSVLALLENNDTPLIGYTLNVDVDTLDGAVGTVTVDVSATNFFQERNLIANSAAAGCEAESLHAVSSVIGNPMDGGVFLNGLSASETPVCTAVAGVNDVLAEVVLDVSRDAFGPFRIRLRQHTEPRARIDGTVVTRRQAAVYPIEIEKDGLSRSQAAGETECDD